MFPDPPMIALLRRLLTAEEVEGQRSVWATARNIGHGHERYAVCVVSPHGTWAAIHWDKLAFSVAGLPSVEVAVRVLAAAIGAAEVA